MTEEIITLDYGSGGEKTAKLIEALLLPAFSDPALDELGDGAVLAGGERLVFSTDSFVVSPWRFPGGDIGKLCICGTVNDICMAGGLPKYISLSFILEEGFPVSDLKEIIASIAAEAKAAGVRGYQGGGTGQGGRNLYQYGGDRHPAGCLAGRGAEVEGVRKSSAGKNCYPGRGCGAGQRQCGLPRGCGDALPGRNIRRLCLSFRLPAPSCAE